MTGASAAARAIGAAREAQLTVTSLQELHGTTPAPAAEPAAK
jgi:hypothetical protein